MKGMEVHSIDPSVENARFIQRLVLEQHIAGDFPKPRRYGDPYNRAQIVHQVESLEKTPDDYAGVYVNYVLAGFIHIDDWTVDRDLDFTVNAEREQQALFQNAGRDMDDPRKLAIATFAVDEKRAGWLYEKSAKRLLDMAVDRAVRVGGVVLNAAFHERDPLGAIALRCGLRFTGRISEPMAYQNVLHRLYTKPLDY